MANDMEMKAKLILDYKEAIKGIQKTAKEANKTFKKQIRDETKHDSAKKRRLQHEKRLAARGHADDIKHQKDILRHKRGEYSADDVQRRKVKRQMVTARQEQTRYRKREEHASRSAWTRQRSMGKMGGIARAGVGALGMIGGFIMGGAISSYQKHLQLRQQQSRSIGLGVGQGRGYSGAGLGFSLQESADHRFQAARATGVDASAELQQTMRARGLSAGEAANTMAGLTQSGTSFEGRGGGQTMARMMKLAVYGGLKKARFIEFQKGVTGLMQAQGGRSAGDIGMGAAVGAAMLSQTGLSGLMGERGAAVQKKMDAAMSNPQEEFSRGFLQRAYGYGPGGKANWVTAEQRIEEGASGRNIKDVIDLAIREGKGDTEAAAMLKMVMKLNILQTMPLIQKARAGNLSLEEAGKVAAGKANLAGMAKGAMSTNAEVTTDLVHKATMNDAFTKAGGGEVAKNMRELQKLQLAAFEKLLPTMMDLTKAGVEAAMDGAEIGQAVFNVADGLINMVQADPAAVQKNLTDLTTKYEGLAPGPEKVAAGKQLLDAYDRDISLHESNERDTGVFGGLLPGVSAVEGAQASMRRKQREGVARSLQGDMEEESRRKAGLAPAGIKGTREEYEKGVKEAVGTIGEKFKEVMAPNTAAAEKTAEEVGKRASGGSVKGGSKGPGVSIRD